MALEGLSQQTTTYGLAMAELMFKKNRDEEIARQANIENWLNYLRAIEQRRHGKAAEKTAKQQKTVAAVGTVVGAALTGGALAGLAAPAAGGIALTAAEAAAYPTLASLPAFSVGAAPTFLGGALGGATYGALNSFGTPAVDTAANINIWNRSLPQNQGRLAYS